MRIVFRTVFHLAVATLLASASVSRADSTYVWVSNDYDPNISGIYGGYLTLDSSASSGGTAADIVSFTIEAYVASGDLTTENATFNVNPAVPFIWDDNKIESMDINFSYPGEQAAGELGTSLISIENVDDGPSSFDQDGQWLSSVPDVSSTCGTFALAWGGLVAVRRRFAV